MPWDWRAAIDRVKDDAKFDASRASVRRWALSMQQPVSHSTLVDRIFFLFATVAALWLAVVVSTQGFRHVLGPLLFIPVWAILAYLALPRIHRMLSDLYVPDYFFGRSRTADGLLGDPINLAVNGSLAQLDQAMRQAGWHRAEDVTLSSALKIVVSTIFRRSYPTAPVSPLMLFGRPQNVAYQQEVEGNPKKRHHVRFWHTPQGWLLPGGTDVDWLGAGTFDSNVGLSLFTMQITHRIDENTDIERDHVISSMTEHTPELTVSVLENFTTGYHSRNGGGDRFITDGNLPIVDVSQVAAQSSDEGEEVQIRHSHEALTKAPLGMVTGGLLAIAITLITAISAVTDPSGFVDQPIDDWQRTTWVAMIIGFFVVLLAFQIELVRLMFKRRHRARFVLMATLAAGVLLTALDYFSPGVSIRLDGTLTMATLQCVALIGITSDRAAAWVRVKPRPALEA
ncbi:LssY C-terminal domain-containing protein [Glutamicibacter endophyticus]|uniref:LssY C-terminal domain-containing protein n=1 Tax=Glutamicibacter endophyticus TaxID=1522174 RepID=UPI003AF1994A